MVGPNNSATPSTQTARSWKTYFPPAKPMAVPVPDVPKIIFPAGPTDMPLVPPEAPRYEAQVASEYKEAQTTLGAHQDASGLIKTISELSSGFRGSLIGGILMTIAGAVWAALSYKNEEGYFWAAVGLTLVGIGCTVINGSVLWCLFGVFPVGFAFGQRIGIIKV